MKALTTVTSAAYPDLIDYAVVDQAHASVGSLHSLWADQDTGQLEFLGVKTGWLFGSNHVVPTAQAQLDEANRTIQVPYAVELIKEAPAVAANAEITEEEEAEIYRYYGVSGGSHHASVESTTARSTDTTTTAAGLATGAAETAVSTTTAPRDTAAATHGTARTAKDGESIEVALQEEQLRVGKRQVDAGAVRLRKIIRTETVNTPVELRREDVVVERIAAQDVRPGDIPAADFKAEDLNITLHREEAVVAKETVVTGAVRVHKTSETETQNVSDTVRKEDVEVDQSSVTNAGTVRDDVTRR